MYSSSPKNSLEMAGDGCDARLNRSKWKRTESRNFSILLQGPVPRDEESINMCRFEAVLEYDVMSHDADTNKAWGGSLISTGVWSLVGLSTVRGLWREPDPCIS